MTQIKGEDIEQLKGKQKERVLKIIDKTEKQQCDSLKHEIKINIMSETDLVSMTINPTTDWRKKGERGLDSMQIILGPRGGVRRSVRRKTFSEDKDLENEKNPFGTTLRNIGFLS